VTAVFL